MLRFSSKLNSALDHLVEWSIQATDPVTQIHRRRKTRLQKLSLSAFFIVALAGVFIVLNAIAPNHSIQTTLVPPRGSTPQQEGAAGQGNLYAPHHILNTGLGGGSVKLASPATPVPPTSAPIANTKQAYQGDGQNCHVRQQHLANQNAVYCNGRHSIQPVVDNIGLQTIDTRHVNAANQPITLGDEAALDYAAYEQQQLNLHPASSQNTNNHTNSNLTDPKSKDPYNCGALDVTCHVQEAVWLEVHGFVSGVGSTLDGTADELRSLGFMYVTPSMLSYGNGVVLQGYQWSIMSLDLAVGFLTILWGYRLLMNDMLGLAKGELIHMILRFLLPLLAAHIFIIFAGPITEIFNNVNSDIVNTLGGGKILDSPSSLGQAIDQGIISLVFAIINCIFTLLLSIEMAVGLILFDLTLIFAPWALAVGGEWMRLWATTFFSVLVAKTLQIATVSLGAALIANLGKTTTIQVEQTLLTGKMPLVSALVALACFYLAFKIPSMLFSQALRASVGAVHRDIILTYFAADRFVSGVAPGGNASQAPSNPASWP